MTDQTKHYARRDLLALGDHFSRHMLAMTAEDLHRKSAIAAELAWRDAEIERLNVALSASAPSAPMVDVVPPATSRDRWMYEQGRLAERDPRTPGSLAAQVASAPAAGSVPSDVDKKRIAHNAHVQCSLIPGATFYNAAEAAIDALLAQYGSPAHSAAPEVAETLRGIVNADWTQWGELACPEEFVRWAKARAAHVLSLLSAPQEGK